MMEKNTLIEEDYRYTLTREWDPRNPRKAVFIMLNPSIADEKVDDRTTSRCISFAKSWNCGSLEIVNIFAFRATDYNLLKFLTKEEATGLNNITHIKAALSTASLIVCAWGKNINIHYDNYDELEDLLKGYQLFCLGRTKEGHPRHPLYVKSATPLEIFNFKKRMNGPKKMHVSMNLRKIEY
jgi:hypothetical protein